MADEVLYWFETLSGKHPAKPIYAINFRWIGLDRDADPREIDNMHLVYIGQMTRAQIDDYINGR